MSTALQPTSIEAVIETRLKELPFPKTTAIDPEGKTYQQIHEEQIAEIERRAKMIDPVIDEATRANTQKALTALTKVRRGIDTFRKDLFAPLTDLKKKFDGYLGTTMDGGLQARIRAIEIPLEESMAKYDRELERIRQEELRKIEDRNKARSAYVVGAGMTFTGTEYKLDELVLWPTDLNTWNDDAFENWKVAKLQPALQAKADREKAAREAAEKAAAEAKAATDKLAADLAKQKADEERLAVERVELERKQRELEAKERAMNERINEARKNELIAVGCATYDDRGKEIVGVPTEVGTWGHVFDVSELLFIPDENWKATVTMCKDEREAYVESARNREEERLNGTPEPEPVEFPSFVKDIISPMELPLGVATELNPDFAPQMEAVHVAPAPVANEPMDAELTVEAQTLVADARFHAARQNSAAYVLSAGDGQFLAFGTADQIRELLKDQ